MWIKIPGENVTFTPSKYFPGRPMWLFRTVPHIVRTVAETALSMACFAAFAIVLYQRVLAGWLLPTGFDDWLWHRALIVVGGATVLVSAMRLWDERKEGKVYSSVWLESLHDTMWTTHGWVRDKPAPVWDSEEFPDLFWTINDPATMLDARTAARALALHWVGGYVRETDNTAGAPAGSIDADDAQWMSELVGRSRAVVVDGDGKRHEFPLRDLLFEARCLAPGVWPSFAWEGLDDDTDLDWSARTAAHGTALRAWATNNVQSEAPAARVEGRGVVVVCAEHNIQLAPDITSGADLSSLLDVARAHQHWDAASAPDEDDDVNPFINEESG
jgi:hypothetical protein